LNRIDRLHAILTHLQSKKKVKAQEVADRFSISLRTVYRDVKALEESGVPVIGEAGSGYSIMEGYRLPPVMFTQEEASALLMGAKLAEQLTDASVKKYFEAALFKIKAILRTTDKEYVDQLTDHIEVLQSRLPTDHSANQYLAAIQKAIVDKKIIFIRYQANSHEEITERQVEPIGLVYYSLNWHMIGWCRLRNGYRDFRLSRIIRLQLKDDSFTNTHPSLHEYIQSMTWDSDLQEVVVRFKKETTRYIQDQKYFYGFVREEEAGEDIRMHFLTASLKGFARWLLMFTDSVVIESPAALTDLTRHLAKEAFEHF
jgi:predicted DNA-binding transcriptional regulator YafY